jgi:hypothetical protein
MTWRESNIFRVLISEGYIEGAFFSMIVPLSAFVIQRSVSMQRPTTCEDFVIGSCNEVLIGGP